MLRALHAAATGMLAEQLNLDNIANNLANAGTVGFRARRVQFEDLLYQNQVVPGSASTQQTQNATGLQIGLGTRPSATEILQTQGSIEHTGNPLDMAIEGQGFFQVLLPDGTFGYTRAGDFQLNNQGQLVTADGNLLQPTLSIPSNATSVTIGPDGTVSVTIPGQDNAQQVGQLQLGIFPNPGGLSSIGNNLFKATTSSGQVVLGAPGSQQGIGNIQQAALEDSNVNVVDQFVQMIEAQRSYEANSRVVRAADQMQQELNSLAQ